MKSRKWLILIILLVLVYLGWKYLWPRDAADAPEAQRGENPALLLDRVWVDSNPKAYTDYVHAMLALSDIPMGIFQKASAYRIELEVFEFKREKRAVKLHFPQSEKNSSFNYTIRRCDDLPPFDLCLELSKNPWHGPKKFYGLSDSSDERAVLGEMAPRLREAVRDAR